MTLPECVAGERCPLCGDAGMEFSTDYRICYGGGVYHAPVLLSWQWESEAAYDRYYADLSQFHTATQIEEGFPEAKERDKEHLKASCARMEIYSAFIGDLKNCTDIGAGTGAFVQAASRSGWTAAGIEMCPGLVNWAREKGREVYCGSWQSLNEGDFADVFTLHDVLEHLTRPAECLLHLKSLLTPGGSIIVEMPEYRGQQADWRHFRPKQHICLYDRESAETLFAACGLNVIAFWRPLRGKLDKAVWVLSP